MKITLDQAFAFDKTEQLRGKRLFRCTSDQIVAIRKLSDSEWEDYSAASRLLADFGRGDQLLIACEHNYQELGTALVALHKAARPEDTEDADTFALVLTLNRRLVSYLASARLYVDFTESRIKRRYGKDSDQVRVFAAACSGVYDRNFSYRFTWKLRNFSQHCGFPIGHVRGSHRIDLATEERFGTLEVCFDLPELLELGGDLWGRLRDEMLGMTRLVPIVDILDEAPGHLRFIRAEVIRAESDALERAAISLFTLLRDPGDAANAYRLGEYQNHEGKLGIEFFDPPVWTLRNFNV